MTVEDLFLGTGCRIINDTHCDPVHTFFDDWKAVLTFFKSKDHVDAAGNPKSVVRKCSESLKNIDKLYEDVESSLVLTGDTEFSCFEDMVWFSKSCRCVCV